MASSTTLWNTIVEGQAHPLAGWTLGPLLTTLTYPYACIHQLRLQMYKRHCRAVKRLSCPVISVGNLTLGGTGKTPIVELIAALLRQEGRRVCVLSRGYGGKRSADITVVSDGRQCLASPEIAGDEPVLLAERLLGVPVIVGKNRYAAGQFALKHFGSEVIVLDDGFQHVQLARDLDIVLLDATRPFGNGRLFPRGDLREGPNALARAHAIVLTCWEPDAQASLPAFSPCTATLPLFRSQHQALDLRLVTEGSIFPLTYLHGRRVLGFCGIGAPAHFRHTLQQLGAHIAAWVEFADHHPYSRADIEQLVGLAEQRSAELLITTEKDAVRLRLLQSMTAPLLELRIRATIVGQEADWRSLILGTNTGQMPPPSVGVHHNVLP